jgi:hypothetical protein
MRELRGGGRLRELERIGKWASTMQFVRFPRGCDKCWNQSEQGTGASTAIAQALRIRARERPMAPLTTNKHTSLHRHFTYLLHMSTGTSTSAKHVTGTLTPAYALRHQHRHFDLCTGTLTSVQALRHLHSSLHRHCSVPSRTHQQTLGPSTGIMSISTGTPTILIPFRYE